MVTYITFTILHPDNTSGEPQSTSTHMVMEGNYNTDFTGKDVLKKVKEEFPDLMAWHVTGMTLFDSWKTYLRFFSPVESAPEETEKKPQVVKGDNVGNLRHLPGHPGNEG